MEAIALDLVTRATHIFFVLVFAVGGCFREVRTARLHRDEPATPAELDAFSRMHHPRCSPHWSYLYPGLGQFCNRQNGTALALATLTTAEIGTAIYAYQRDNDPGVVLPIIALQDLYVYGVADAFIQRSLYWRQPYTPPDTLGDLITAPFNLNVLKRPRVWAGTLVMLGLGIGLSYWLERDSEKDPGSRPNVFGRDFDPALGYSIAYGTYAGLFSHVAPAEETLFRGHLQSRLTAGYGETAGWLSASAIFGATHTLNAVALEGDERRDYLLYAVPYITLVRAYLGWTYKEEGYTLQPSTAEHFWYDFLLSAYFFALNPKDNDLSANFTIPFDMSRLVLVVIALVVLNGALLVAGLGKGKSTACDSGTCVGLVFDIGGRGDKSFNDSAYRGLMRAVSELGVHAELMEPASGADRESAVRQLAVRGMDIIIAVGFIFSEDITRLAHEFPNVRFAGIDFVPPSDGSALPPNLAALNFREQEGSFLVGAIAGLVTKTKTLGMVGGMRIPLIAKFEAGYRKGISAVCPDCTVLVAYIGTTPEAWANPAAGQALAKTQYGRGADIVYQVAGRSGNGVFNAAREVNHWAIGVDSDQFEEAPCCILTSMLKRIDVAVFETIKSVHDGSFKGGMHEFGLSENGVAYVYDEHNKDRISAAVIATVNELADKVKRGDIEVPSE